jgi:hypothetical protein
MYLNGQGVEKDLIKAYAWTALSAERHYPDFAATRNQIWRQLDSRQRQQALALEQSLVAQYGDEVAKPRQIQAMHLGWTDIFTYTHVTTRGPGPTVVPTAGNSSRACSHYWRSPRCR